MKVFDKIFFGIIFGAMLPIAFFIIGWWGTVGRVSEDKIFLFAFAGLAIGIILNFLFLRKFISNMYEISASNLIVIYIFYTVCCFGFFMGVPIFNILLGIPAGYYAAMRCLYLRKENVLTEQYFRHVSIFSSIIMFFVCVASAIIAFSDPFTAKNIKGMLGLDFEISKLTLLILVLIGGALLIVIQYFLTNMTAKLIYKFYSKEEVN